MPLHHEKMLTVPTPIIVAGVIAFVIFSLAFMIGA